MSSSASIRADFTDGLQCRRMRRSAVADGRPEARRRRIARRAIAIRA